jgi:hypothetical protein
MLTRIGSRDESCYGRTCWNESRQCSYQLDLCDFAHKRTSAEIQRCHMVRTIGLQTTKACNYKTWNIQLIYLINSAVIFAFGESLQAHRSYLLSLLTKMFRQKVLNYHRAYGSTSEEESWFHSRHEQGVLFLCGSGSQPARTKRPATEAATTLV